MDPNDNVPLLIATELAVKVYLFSCHPLNIPNLKHLASAFITNLASSELTSLTSFSAAEQNGIVELFSSSDILRLAPELLPDLLDLIRTCDMKKIKVFAESVDVDGRVCIDVAIPAIKVELQKRLLFLGRYKLQSGPPLHKSATCIVVNAEDYNAREDYIKKFKEYKRDAISRAEFDASVAR